MARSARSGGEIGEIGEIVGGEGAEAHAVVGAASPRQPTRRGAAHGQAGGLPQRWAGRRGTAREGGCAAVWPWPRVDVRVSLLVVERHHGLLLVLAHDRLPLRRARALLLQLGHHLVE